MNRLVVGVAVALLTAMLAFPGAWLYGGSYALHALLHVRGGCWTGVSRDDPGLSPSVRRALRDAPRASVGAIAWRDVRDGFAVGELPALVDGRKSAACSLPASRPPNSGPRFSTSGPATATSTSG